jgi:CHAT domain-containing protein/tetratricopeptide (TPR) repeat protein
MFHEANALFRVEINRTAPTAREPVFEDFLAVIAQIPTSRGKDYIEAAVRLQYVTTYLQLSDVSRAMEEMKKSEAAFNSWCAEFNITDRDAVPHSAGMLCAALEFRNNHMQKLEWAETISDYMERVGSSKTGICLSTAAESAYALYESTNEEEYLVKCFSLYKRVEHFDENVSEDICDLVQHRIALIGVTYRNVGDRQKSLEWIDGFFKRYPYFALPGELQQLHTKRALLLRGLRKLAEAEQADSIAAELNGKGPSFGKWMNLSFNNTLNPSTSTNHASEYDPEDEEVDLAFTSFWAPIIGDRNRVADTVFGLLYDWSLEDVVAGRITVEQFRNMMNISESQLKDSDMHGRGGKEIINSMKSKEPGSISSLLLPPDARSEISQEARRGLVVDWLSNAPKGQRNNRIFCLLMLHEIRQCHFSDQHLWDLQIIELEHLLEFYPKLPGQMREVCRSYVSTWYCALALAYEVQLGEAPNFSDPEKYDQLLKTEKYCELAVAELRKTHFPAQLALQQRLGAEICIRKIVRLEQLLREPWHTWQVDHHIIEPKQEFQREERTQQRQANGITASTVLVNPMDVAKEIAKIRSIGLEKIEESYKIFAVSELESWEGGLDVINERQAISKDNASFRNINFAIILLLMEARDPSQETISEIWNWVQKAKARSLARTIGRGRDIPPGLMSDIFRSNDARQKYEEMVVLQKRIQDAEPSARFDLRRQLDAKRRSMKTDPLLRRLIDLYEGTPLKMSEIAAIGRGAKCLNSIALIDWYYLPPYANVAGKMLLFTARAHSAPTMDILTTKLEHAYMWQVESLQNDGGKALCDIQTRNSFDNLLGGLVAPLSFRTKQDDVLVLCPSTVFLHRLPLHALLLKTSPLGEQDSFSPLIHRNPVVYIHSHSLLRSCFSATEHARHSPAAIKPQFLAGISKAHAAEYTNGRTSITDLAGVFNTPPMIDESASKTQFLTMAKQSRFLHLHTHCNWNPKNPLDHHVEFPQLEGAQGLVSPDDLKLTAREVFEMSLLPGAHVTMIACQGGLTDVQQGDEVMGLVPALLYSGASSTISTLWSIADKDGAAFSKLFFKHLIGQFEDQDNDESCPNSMNGGKEGACFVDMARALQGATVKMDRYGKSPLYSWASFILHGFWQLPLSNDDVRWMATRATDALKLSLEEKKRLGMVD